MRQESFLKSIGTAIIWRSLDRIAGLAKHVIVAAVIGLSSQLDVFYMATALLGALVFSWGNLIDVVAVPNMVKAWREGRKDELKQITSGMFALTLVCSLLLALVLYSARDLMATIAIGFEANRKQLLVDSIPWLLPVILLFIPFRLMGAVLRAQRQFTPFYQAEFLIAFIVLICVVFFRDDGHVLLWSFSVGITGAFIFLFSKTWRHVTPLANPFSPMVRQALQMAPGLLILQGSHYAFVLTDQIFVSFLPNGNVSALAYAMTLTSLLPTIASFSSSFITVVSEHRDIRERTKKLNDLITLTIYIGLGATCFVMTAGDAIVQVLLERGVFTSQNTKSVATTISACALMIFPIFLIAPLDQIFQVERRIGLMVRRTVLGMLTNIILSALFLFGFGWGLFGVALATSVSYWVMLFTGLHSLGSLGYCIHRSQHLKWGLWNGTLLVFVYASFIFFPIPFLDGLPKLLLTFLLISGVLLFAGVFYRGNENMLVRQTINRCLPSGLKA